MNKINSKEKKELIKFIKDQLGETIVYSQDKYPLYFDDEGKMMKYDLDEAYNAFKLSKNG